MVWFSSAYPPEQKIGYWGKVTSTIDWCEENYVTSSYIAEACNTVTNAFSIVIALYAIYNAYTAKLGTRFLLMSLGFLLVGIGSWLFHMTLKYHFQLLDELPMIYATCIPCWSVFSEFQLKRTSILIGLGIFFGSNLLTLIYLWVRNPTIHQTAFGFLNVMIIAKSYFLTRDNVKDDFLRRELYKTMAAGISIFLFGYLLWNLDIHFCNSLRGWRRTIGMPLGFLLEGHAWWHIFTETGVYYYLVYEEYLRSFLLGTDRFYSFSWVYCFPVVRCTDRQGLKRHNEVKELAKKDAKFLEKKNL